MNKLSLRLPLGLDILTYNKLKSDYDLSFHFDYLDICAKSISFAGLDVLEVGGALPPPLVIDHLGCNSWTAVESPEYDWELGAANQINKHNLVLDGNNTSQTRYKHCLMNIETADQPLHSQFDLIFSIAAFEHISRLPKALEAMFLCLRPGGRLFTMFSPVWSAHDGYHLPLSIPKRFQIQEGTDYIFKPYGHLLQTRKSVYADLKQRFDSSFAEEVVYYTYNSPHINRYFTDDYCSFFTQSAFQIDSLLLTFVNHPAPNLQKALCERYPSYSNFANNGIYLTATRPSSAIHYF